MFPVGFSMLARLLASGYISDALFREQLWSVWLFSPELSPVGLQDTDVPGQIRDYISQRPWRHRTDSQPASPSMPQSILGE